jgi:hypothetical protein
MSRLRATNKPLYDSLESKIEPILLEKGIITNINNNEMSPLNIEAIMEISDYPIPTRTLLNETIYQAIYDLLAKKTESLDGHIRNSMNGTVVGQTAFKNLLCDHRLQPTDFFITLNYDLYLDREVLTANSQIDLGLSKGRDREIRKAFLPVVRDNHYSVFHLHGALNWEYHDQGNQIIVKNGAIRPTYRIRGPSVCLVPPGIKQMPSILQSIWKLSRRRCKGIDELIIIGCSLNPLDTELIELVKEVIDRISIENVKIIHKSKDTEKEIEHFNKIIGEGYQIYSEGFDIPDAIDFIFS